uniref:Glyoxylate reductase/hydroxypyruvate reductase n=1 Tax=Lynx canadensis TaxID=61383 RepID=A0A667IEZ8_LYNCA
MSKLITERNTKRRSCVTFSAILYRTSSIFMQVGSQSCPNRMTTTRSSSERMAWSTCQPLCKCGSMYDIFRAARVPAGQEFHAPSPSRQTALPARGPRVAPALTPRSRRGEGARASTRPSEGGLDRGDARRATARERGPEGVSPHLSSPPPASPDPRPLPLQPHAPLTPRESRAAVLPGVDPRRTVRARRRERARARRRAARVRRSWARRPEPGGWSLRAGGARAGHRLAIAPDTENFSTNWMGQEVTGATLGIIGMGSIGYKIAQRARAFEMKILYHNRKRRKLEEEEAVGATYCESLDDLLQRSDFVLLAVSLTPQTQRLIGKRELNLMKPTAILVNIGRGLLVDQDALVQALQTGVIKGAALDVTHPEPLPRDHPLLKLENVTLTPHAGSATHQARRQMMENLVASILASLHGLPIPNEVRLNWDNSVA